MSGEVYFLILCSMILIMGLLAICYLLKQDGSEK